MDITIYRRHSEKWSEAQTKSRRLEEDYVLIAVEGRGSAT
jgi:hypothetical protein